MLTHAALAFEKFADTGSGLNLTLMCANLMNLRIEWFYAAIVCSRDIAPILSAQSESLSACKSDHTA